jgi:hypothetical protein
VCLKSFPGVTADLGNDNYGLEVFSAVAGLSFFPFFKPSMFFKRCEGLVVFFDRSVFL